MIDVNLEDIACLTECNYHYDIDVVIIRHMKIYRGKSGVLLRSKIEFRSVVLAYVRLEM